MVTATHSARQREGPRAGVCPAAVLVLTLAVPLVWGQPAPTLAEQVRTVLLLTVHLGDPPKAAQLTGLAARTGVPIEHVHEVLLGLAGQSLPGADPAGETAVLARRAIEALGSLQVAAAAPLLERIAAQDQSLRGTAIRARTRIGGDGLLSFAGSIIERQDVYPELDRYALYEELSPYVGVDPVQAVPLAIPGERGGGGERHRAVVSLLVRAVATDPDADNFMRLDQVLSLADSVYRRSDLREARLQTMARSRAAVHQAYADEQLTHLRALPAAERTRLEVETPVGAPGP